MYPFQVDKEVKKDLWHVTFLQQRCRTSEKIRDQGIVREKANLDMDMQSSSRLNVMTDVALKLRNHSKFGLCVIFSPFSDPFGWTSLHF